MQRPNPPFHRRGGGERRNATGNSARPPPSSSHPPYPQHPPQSYPYNPYYQNQNPNPNFHDPNLLLQQIASLIQYPTNAASSSTAEYPPGVNPPAQNQMPKFPPQFQHQQRGLAPNRRETLEKIEFAVEEARREMIGSAENVSTWRVIQSVLVKLKAESWESLGFQIQQVPSLHNLIVTEGKINAFIHCFVAVRTISSLYDMEVAICENEGIEKFEELGLGPLIRHPLVEHYFLSKDMTEVYKITGEEIISHLKVFILKLKGKNFDGKAFLNYVANECRVPTWEKMGLRIQSLGTHIGFIRDALRQEDVLMKTFSPKEKNSSTTTAPTPFIPPKEKNSSNGAKKRPLFSLEKKQIDERYNTISERVASFSSAHKDFRGKHIRFNSSSSDDNNEDVDDEDELDSHQRANDWDKPKDYPLSSQTTRSDKGSRCPYPSQAEEMTRLGLRGETNSSSPATCILKENDERVKKKRKLERKSCRDKEKTCMTGTDLALSNDSIRMFITTWKEACRQHTATEVFENMLEHHCTTPKQKKKLKSLVSMDLFLGLLNVAVMSIKNGSWDSIYDTFESFDELGCTSRQSNKCIVYESLDVELGGNDLLNSTDHISEPDLRVTVEDIIRKVTEYFANESPLSKDRKSPFEAMILLARKLLHCEVWINKKFSVKDFDSLGYGEYLTFIERNISLLPKELHENISTQVHDKFSFEVSLPKEQLLILLSQASDSLWEDGVITKHRIANLLSRQFPLITFDVVEKGYLDNFLDTIKEHKNSITSNCILFSATLMGTSSSCDSVDDTGNHSLDCASLGAEAGRKGENVGSFTPKDALEVLLKAPMLVDLNACLHWDTVYAPSLGPLVRWLLTEVNARDLLCLLTRDGKIVRIDPLASADSFFKALLNGSSFQVAVELLSLFALYGGRRHLPLSLLKCHARQAFEVLLTNPIDRRQSHDWSSLTNNKNSSFTPGINICMKNDDGNTPTSHVSRLVLDCLGYLPSEFCSLAADILIFGMQSVVKCAPSSVLLLCNSNEQRLMLHEVGFALGIAEWIDDHQKVCPMSGDQSSMPIPALHISSFSASAVEFGNQQQVLANVPQELPSVTHDQQHEGKANASSFDICVRDGIQDEAQVGQVKDAALLIESIRREEFGLCSDVESSILEKQHARLGRALKCLSQELYSQDSHFLLELLQNADDNAYLGEVEPTLVFILQNSGIIVLNNEKGFTAQNIRALCDVGNSTKKGSSSGYIGQKGIGFKSVFRVTDAPEIHSNGFHIKFDITEGQIGFVLPTVVPPCTIDVIGQLASAYPDKLDINGWNTCMVLPFKSKLTQGLEMGKIISMFSDIHPSLLLFLHRLQCIKFINMLDNSIFAMRKEIIGDGLMKVSYGENKITWFIASKKLSAKKNRPDVEQTEISIAFTLKESENCNYEPHLEQQPVFAFLPLRTYGLKFILQGDFVLPSSREEVDGDSSWNQWLLSEFPDLFVSAEKSFCSLPCFRGHPGKAVAAYMHFVPLIGEVQGFFYGLPRMIIYRLRQSACLLQEGCDKLWVPPCKVLRSWNEQARVLLPDILLHEHLGLGFLDKDIILPDSLARALGIQEYGPKILDQFLSSICCAENGLKSMGLRWLSLCLNEIHVMLHSPGKSTENASIEMDLITSLRKVPFLPLSDGTYGSISEGTIWLNIDSIKTSADDDTDSKAFPKLYSSLRIVSPSLFSAVTDGAYSVDDNFVNNIASILHKIGVQHLTAHEIIKAHILPIISDDKIAKEDISLFLECNAFVMLHLQSSCTDCSVEREHIIAELQSKAFLLTNHGFKRLRDVAIHFGKEFGNSVDVSRFTRGIDYKWHEIDVLYLKHPLTGSLACGLKKWREFFHSLGVTDFVKVTQTERNISDVSSNVFQQVKWDRDLIFSGMMVRDWESQELDSILSSFARNGNHESSKYLLEVLDTLWDDYFCDRTACYFSCQSGENNTSVKSSLMNNICDVRWITSSMDKELHYPRDLFYDCDAVRSILGNFAPYAIPKIKNNKLLADIGFKTAVTIDDILTSLQKWRILQPFKASISQMSRLYTFIARELATSKKKVMDALSSGPFIFVPCASGVSQEDAVVGLLLSPEEVYWHDRSGALDSMKKFSSTTPDVPVGKILCDIYPGLRDFFVDVCGVNETPPFRCYLQILKQISMSTLPLEAANAVFQVFLRWSDGLRCGAMVDDDIFYLRDHLLMLEFAVLPALQDKWVSLHPSFGLVCWVDDNSLKKQFKHSDNIEFLYFGELTSEGKEMLKTKVSVLMQKLGIPSLKEVVTHEAIYYGPTDSSFKASLVAWSLPFAQRYIYTKHSEKYAQLKLSRFEKLQGLKIVVVEKLYYRNVIKKCGATSKKRTECSCLLQDMVLYATQNSDTESLFTELARLFFDGVLELELDLAKFLHILTAMAESGFTEQQMEFFILNSQKMPKVPDDEPIWSLSSLQSSEEHDQANQMNSIATETNELKSPLKPKNKGSLCWPPAGWKTAPGFDYGILSKGSSITDQGWYEAGTSDNAREVAEPTADMAPAEISEDYIIEEDVQPEMSRASKDQLHSTPEHLQSRKKSMAIPTDVVIESYCPEDWSLKPNDIAMTPEAQEAAFVGRLGEEIAFRHLKGKHGTLLVKWMNEQRESGLPYDIVIGEKGADREYMEVKATRYASKNWVKISTREWQFAVEKGDSYSIFHIVLQESAKITIFKNPVKLCQLGKLDLAVMMPRQQLPRP